MRWWMVLALGLAACNKDEVVETDETDADTDSDTDADTDSDTDTDTDADTDADTDTDTDTDTDLPDSDGDGSLDVDDCDDADPDVFPGADEACNGRDDDCDGAFDEGVAKDDDGDDHLDEAVCSHGDDCDDANADVYPGHVDWMNDAIDSDCDGRAADAVPAADAAISVVGASATSDVVGMGLAVCDLDADGYDDLLVGAPFRDGYAGAVGIFYGSGAGAWSAGMALEDADTLITGTSAFLGMEIACGDIDGDGSLDIAVSRSEYFASGFDNPFGVVLFYGDGAEWPAAMTDGADGVEFSFSFGTTDDLAWADHLLADLDDDGDDDLVLDMNEQNGVVAPNDPEQIWVIAGDRYVAGGALDAMATVMLDGNGTGITTVEVAGDLDGDGLIDLFAGEPFTEEDSDTAAPEGRGLYFDGAATGAIETAAYASLLGENGYGSAATFGDFDGDGLPDAAISSYADDTFDVAGGGVHIDLDVAKGLAGALDATARDDAHVAGTALYGYFGWSLQAAGDLNLDGADDLLVAENAGSSGFGRVWLLEGDALSGEVDLGDAALLAWDGAEAASFFGNMLAVGDIDGDGVNDIVTSAPLVDSYRGEVYITLTGGWF